MVRLSDEAEVQRKLKKASQLLLLQRHRSPGVKGWELKRALGKEYLKIIDVLRTELDRLGLEVKIVYDGSGKKAQEASSEDTDRARFFVVMKGPLSQSEMVSSGWRIDDVAVLAATIAYINSRQGKAPRKQVEELLREKFPRWKVDMNLDRFVRRGYLLEGEDDMLYIGWRTRAEIDQKTLTNLILATPTGQDSQVK
ncbi:MAG: hypothetical protein V3W09_01840 [Nitrososphaerales archaeon]